MKLLDELVVLFIDCQATGAVPGKADIIEIGWARSDACHGNADIKSVVNSFYVKMPDNRKISRRIQAITGIVDKDTESGLLPRDVWKRLEVSASEVTESGAMESCPTVIHYAKYEEPFLRCLHRQSRARGTFPFTIICTHEIGRRVFSWLPRRSIRAIAGYFGFTIGEYHRCREHVAATALIWYNIQKVLKQQYRITTLEDLQQWLREPASCAKTQKDYPMRKEIRQALPDRPGVYRMLNSNGDLLYIGKASSLRKRVNSYFRKSSRHPEHIMEMISQAKKLDTTVTGSVLEAAIMESDEIKLLAPPYNIALRKNARTVWFLGSDFEKISSQPSASCKIGPFSSDMPLLRLSAIKRLIYRRMNEPDALFCAAVGVRAISMPDIECLRRGFASFLDQHVRLFETLPSKCAFEQLGKNFWQQHNEISVSGEDEERPSWTPASVKRIIESNIRHDMHEMRRARLLVWLSESVIAWEESGKIALVIFEKGRLLHRETVRADHTLPVPPGYRYYDERLEYFDAMSLDRMKVLAAELRRLVAEGKWLRLCLRPGVILDRQRLGRIFYWV